MHKEEEEGGAGEEVLRIHHDPFLSCLLFYSLLFLVFLYILYLFSSYLMVSEGGLRVRGMGEVGGVGAGRC